MTTAVQTLVVCELYTEQLKNAPLLSFKCGLACDILFNLLFVFIILFFYNITEIT